jgi:hypothetical protein
MSDEKKSLEPEQGGSEVQRLREQIGKEYEAAQQGLTGLTYGISKHEFITHRMNTIGKIQEELEKLVGPEEAGRMIVEQLDKADPPEKPEKDKS